MVPDISSLRDQIWLLAHDETRDLRPRIDVRALEIGLTGATLIDLLLQDRIHVDGHHVYSSGRHAGVTGDPVCAAVLHIIGGRRGLGPPDPAKAPRLTDVLRDPSLRMYARTEGMLIAAGVLVEQHRRMRATYYGLDPSNINQSLRTQLTKRLYHAHSPATPAEDGLCALVWALNLHQAMVMAYDTHEVDAFLRMITRCIPERYPHLAVLPHLATQVSHAIGDLATAAF